MLRTLLHRLIGYRVVISCKKGLAKNDEPFESRCWLARDCTLRARWHGKQVILNSDNTVTGMPKDWLATWDKVNKESADD